jgi:hypothetical protein
MRKIALPDLLCKSILIGCLLFFISIQLTAQAVTNYTFAASNGTFTALSSPSATSWTGNTDDAVSGLIPIGFDFWYMGIRYTNIAASTNGWLALGSVPTDNLYTNSLSSGGAPRPVIAPLWDDLDIIATTNVTYKTTGTAGSQVFTLQYLNVKWNYQASGSVCSFQVKLYESTGKIEFVYRSDAGAANVPSASIGITAAATGSGNFLSVNNAGTSTSSTSEANITTKRTTGRTYAFTAPVPTAPGSLTFTGVGNTAMTLNWTDLSNNERGFAIYRSTDGVNYSFVTQTAAGTTSSSQTGLTGGTTYYWKVYAVTEGALSTALSGSQATVCTPPAAPAVTSPVNYCQNATATQLTATGTNLLWAGVSIGGSAGGNSTLSTTVYVDAPNAGNNRKTNFTTTAANVTITTIDYYIPAFQAVSGLVLAIFNSSGTVIATSSTTTTQTAGTSAIAKTNIFNYTITAAGNYSIGIASGTGVIGSDNPGFPITEPTGTINVTGVSVAGYRCFNNIQFTAGSATAPTPATTVVGTTNYTVTQTVGGCVSSPATITVNVTAPNISQIPATNLIANYTFSGNANDATGNNNGTLQNAPVQTTDRFGIANRAYSMNGSSQYISTTTAYVNPADFTLSIWFKTSTVTGGKLIGFGREQVGASGQYDRHIYMNNAGQVYFGVYSGVVTTVNSPLSYNDNNWHLATATLSGTAGMVLYIDGAQVGANAAGTAGENYTGYWKIGYDNISGWTSQPSSFYFNGALDDALIYSRVLSPSEITTLYTSPDGAGNNGPVCTGSSISLSATSLGGATYAWSGPNSYTSASQNPTFTYTAAAAGVYALQVTAAGCTATAYTNVTATTNAGQWTGNVSTDWADGGNWCTGVVPTNTANVIITSSATRMPSIISSAACNNLTVNAGATLTIAAAGTLNIAGTLTNNGTVTNGGTTNFNGSSGQQTFSGVSSFYNLTLNNTGGLLLPAAITVNNNLLLSAGTLDANNFNIAVKGSWTNNASTTAFTAGTATVTFNGATAQAIGGSFVTTFNHLTIADTVTLSANTSLNGNLTVSSGIFDLAGFTANRASAGGTLTVANNATLKIGGTSTYPTNYTTNTLVVASTVAYAGTNQTVANQLYGNLTLSSSGGAAVKTFPGTALTVVGNLSSLLGTGTSVSFTAASDITVSGNVSIGASTTFNGGSYSHSIGGNWVNNGTFNGNTSTITLTGAGTTVSGSGTQNFNNLTVAASLVVFSAGSISLTGSLATTGSGSFSQASGGTVLMTGSGATISGSGISLDNLTVSGTVSTATSLTLTGNLAVSGSFTASSGIITMSGASKTISGAGTSGFNILSVTGSVTTTANFSIASGLAVNGSLSASAGTATFTGTATLSGTAQLFNTTINGTSLQLSTNASLGIANVLTITAGTLDVTSSAPNTVNFNSTGAQNINAITYNNLTLSNGNSKTALGNITVNNNITIATGTTFIPGTFTHSIYKDWNNAGSFTAGASTIQFLGSTTSNISGNTTFNILTINTATSITEILLQSNVSAATVNMTNGVISTGSDTITITNTRTGNGKLLGNIRRNHSFTTGVDYAFESPYNTITFSAVSAVTSITVSITENQIDDFPFGGSMSEEYDVTVPAGTYTATLRLDYEEDELNGNNESSMTLWKYNGSSWAAVGKTANNTTLNYVEQSGLTNITARWTLSDAANLVQWNGSVSTDWHTAANWTTLQGAPSKPPSASDIVDVGTASFTYQPTISVAESAKNIHFGSAQAVTLTIASGGSLTTAGNIDGDWSANAVHTINVNNQNLVVNGNMNLSDGINGQSINLNIGSGTVHVVGALFESGDASVNFSGAGTLNIHKDFSYSSGTFSAGTGTVAYIGDENQEIANVTYNNLTINKADGLAAINDTVAILGNLLIASGELDNFSNTTIAGDVTISSGTTFSNNNILYVGGNWANSGSYTGEGINVIFDGSGTQTITPTTFNSLTINKPVGSTAVFTGDIGVNGDLTVLSGTLNVQSFNCSRDILGGAITLADSATVILSANNPPVNFANISLANSSTIIFDGTGAQTIAAPGISFGHLTLRNAGVKTLASPLIVNGNLTIENGAVFDGGTDNAITLNGHWTNSGTFIPSTSTVLCTGTAKNITGNTTFNKVTVFGSYTILNDVTFNGLLNITSAGSLSGGGTIHTTLHGDLINSGVLYTLGTTTFSGNVVQTLSLINAVTTVALTVNFNGTVSPVLNSTSAPQYGFLNINNTGGVNPSVGWNILYSLTVGSGASFNGGITTHNILGAVTNNGTITSSGTLNFIPSTAATVNLGSNFSSTGTVVFGGAGAMTLAGTPSSFRNVVVSNTNVAGITPSADWNITNNFTVNSGSILHAGSRTYSVGGNILAPGTINSGTSTFILNGTNEQDINIVSAFKHLTVNKSAGVSALFSNATINGVLNFVAGKIKTGSYVLIQPSSGTVTGAAQNTGWVYGNLQKNIVTGATVKTFEVGDSASYTPVTVAFSSVTTAGDLTVFTISSDHPSISSSTIDASESVNRFWTLVNSGIVFTDYSATFNYVATDVDAGVTTSAVIAGRYSDGVWTYPTVGTVTSTSIQATGLTAFVDFQIGEMIVFVKTWDGGAGTHNWGDAANWNRDGVPTAADDVELTRADTININVAATTKHLLLNNASLVLTTEAGHSLAVSGNFTLSSGTFNTAAAFPTVSGTIDVAGGTVGFTGSGAQTIPAYNYNNLTSSSTGSRTLANGSTIGIAGLFTPGANAYTITGNTIDFNGNGAQTVSAFNYNNLTLSNTGEKTFSAGTTAIAETLSVTGSATANATTNASTLSYNGSTAQTIAPITYYNLDAAGTAGVVTLLDATVNNDLSITTGTVSIGNSSTAQTITVGGNITIASGAALQVASTSNATHLLTVSGDVTNSGTLSLRPDANSLCNTTFNKNGIQTIAGPGATTSFNNITTNLGVSNSNYLDVTATNFSAPVGFLTLNNGSFNLNSAGVSITPFAADITTGNFLIPATAGLWVNAGTIQSPGMNWTVAGLVKVTGGSLNMGSAADNIVIPKQSASFAITAGNMNLASRISNPGATWTLLMKGGTMTVNTQGSTTADAAPFNMDATGCIFDMSGGTIVIRNAGGTAGQHLSYHNLATDGPGFTGGTLQMGDASTAAAQTMKITSTTPVYNLLVNSANVTAILETTDLAVSNNVTITGGTLNINSQTLQIGDSIINNGSFIASDGTIEMNGIAAQTIPASAFTGNLVEHLIINDSVSVTLEGPLQLTGILLVSYGQLNAGGYLTLVSTATRTALIDGSGAGDVLGDVIVQRYLASGFGYKYVSSPFQAATVNEFSDDVALGASFPTFYRYDESQVSSGWISYTNTTNALAPMQGYAANMGASSAAKTVDATGVVNNNTITLPTLYNHNETYTLGFNLVGNPYPSPIDWNAAGGWSRTNIDDAVYYFNAGATNQYTGTYSSYINGVSSDGVAGNVIAAMQGFFVHVSNGSFPVAATLGINNSARINNLAPSFFRGGMPLTAPLLRLSAGFAAEKMTADPMVVYFDDAATRAFDQEMDALKLMNTDSLVPSLYVVASDTARLSICAWPGADLQDTADIIPLGLTTKRAGWVLFNASSMERIPYGRHIYLYDAKTGVRQDLQDNPQYRLYLDAGEYKNRFFLVFCGQAVVTPPPAAAGGTFKAYSAAGKLYVQISGTSEGNCDVVVTNMLGQIILRKQLRGNNTYELAAPVSTGIYIVSFYTPQQVVSQKVFIGH